MPPKAFSRCDLTRVLTGSHVDETVDVQLGAAAVPQPLGGKDPDGTVGDGDDAVASQGVQLAGEGLRRQVEARRHHPLRGG